MFEKTYAYIAQVAEWLAGAKEYFVFDPKFGWTAVVQIIGFGVAICTVYWQLKKQRELQDDNHKTSLQIDIYEKATAEIEKGSPTGIAEAFSSIPALLRDAEDRATKLGRYVPPPIDAYEIDRSYKEIHKNLYKTIATIEKYEIVQPNLCLFRRVLMKKVGEMTDAYINLIKVLPYVLVSEEGIDEPDKLMRLNAAELTTLERFSESFCDAAYDVAAYLHDIQIELQISLLSRHFQNEVCVRRPETETHLVLTSSDTVMLDRARAYLEN